MIAVIFEVEPAPDAMPQYLDIAASLRPELEKIDGFISVERFQSLTTEGKILSLSFFETEEAIEQWRTLEKHRAAQEIGRSSLFSNYRLRIASVIRDYGLDHRTQAPKDSKKRHPE